MAERLVSVRLLLNPAGYVGGAAQVQRANAAMTASTTATARRSTAATGAMTAGMQRTGASMGNVAAQAGLLRGGLVNPITAAGAAVIGATKASIDWESAWAGVTKTVDGSATQMERLEGDLRGMARELPATHGEIAATAEAAGQLGVKVDDVQAFTRTMVDLGETTNLSASDAATSIARLTNIMGTSQDEVDRLGSSLVDLGNNSATTEAEILTLGTRLAAAGNIAGLSEADVLAFAAAMTSVGVNAEAGGTAMSKVFTQMRDAVIDGGEQLEVFAAVAGQSAEQFATAFREDPAMAIAAFIDGMGRMNAAGESTTRVFEDLELTDQRLMRAVLSTAEAGDLLVDSIELASDAWQDNVALTAEAEQRYNTTAARISRSWNTIKDAAISGGEPVAEVFAMLAEGTADLITGLEKADDAFKNMFESAGLPTGKWEGLRDFGELLREIGVPEDLLFTDFDAEKAQAAVSWSAKYKSEIQGLQNRLPEAAEASADFADAQGEVAEETQAATDMLALYQEHLQASTDPVLNLVNQLENVEEKQTAYNEAVDEYGKNSPEAINAGWDLAEATAAAEAAALDGELSFDAFEGRLAAWVQQGILTEAEADVLRGSIKDLRGEAEDYQGPYDAHLTTSDVKKSDQEIRGLTNRADRYDRNYVANLGVHGTRAARSEIQGLLNRAAAWRGTHTATFISNNIVRGSVGNLFAGRGHDGGMVTTAGVQRFHGGGEVTSTIPRFHEGTTRLGANEVPAILEVGEAVVSKRDMAMAAAMSSRPAGRGAMGGGGMDINLIVEGRGAVGEARAAEINHMLRKGQLNIRAEAIVR